MEMIVMGTGNQQIDGVVKTTDYQALIPVPGPLFVILLSPWFILILFITAGIHGSFLLPFVFAHTSALILFCNVRRLPHRILPVRYKEIPWTLLYTFCGGLLAAIVLLGIDLFGWDQSDRFGFLRFVGNCFSVFANLSMLGILLYCQLKAM